MEVIFDNRSC